VGRLPRYSWPEGRRSLSVVGKLVPVAETSGAVDVVVEAWDRPPFRSPPTVRGTARTRRFELGN
jgi:hypothetical protein